MKHKVLITGGNGTLAKYVRNVFSDCVVFSPSHEELDITNQKNVDDFFKENEPDVAMHLAAKTNVDECEKNPEAAFAVNGEGTKNIALSCKSYNSFLVYVSTAAVFDGKREVNFEEDSVSPVNKYGQSKLLGEKYIQEILEKYLIFRAAWLIGGGKAEKKFVSYIVDQIGKGKDIMAVNDKVGTLTYAKELADAIRESVDLDRTGIFHFGSKGACSRFDIAQKIVAIMDASEKVIPVGSQYFSNSFSAPRPDREVIGSKKIEFSSSWQESLENYLRKEMLENK